MLITLSIILSSVIDIINALATSLDKDFVQRDNELSRYRLKKWLEEVKL